MSESCVQDCLGWDLSVRLLQVLHHFFPPSKDIQVRLNDDCMLPVSGWVLFDELGCTQPLSHGLWSFFVMLLTSCFVFRVYFLCHHVKFVVYIPCVYYFYIII